MAMRRRDFLLTGSATVGVAAVAGPGWASGQGKSKVAAAPALSVSVKEHGAVGDGVAKDTQAIQETIDKVGAASGGGEVVIPAGVFLTGGIELRSGVTLRVAKDAVLRGSPDFADYKVGQVRWEGKWIEGYFGLISAHDCQGIAIVGEGLIQGAPETGGRPTKELPRRHPCLIEPISCRGVRLEGFSTDYSRMWSIHPTYCESVAIKGLTIRSTGGNGDGIDVDSCRHVKIDRCDISTGDDCISIKSGRGMEGYKLLRTSEDIEIANCTFADSIFACIGIGSETSGGIRNVRIAHCKFTAAKTHAIYIKSRPGRGAFVEDISVNDIDVANTTLGFLRINMAGSGIQDEFPVGGMEGIPTVKNYTFRNVRVTGVPMLVQATELTPDKPLEGLVLDNISGTCAKGIFIANAKGVVVNQVTVTGFEGKLLNTYNVTGKGLEGAVALDAPKAIPPVATVPYTLK
jgi:polygalacturonase